SNVSSLPQGARGWHAPCALRRLDPQHQRRDLAHDARRVRVEHRARIAQHAPAPHGCHIVLFHVAGVALWPNVASGAVYATFNFHGNAAIHPAKVETKLARRTRKTVLLNRRGAAFRGENPPVVEKLALKFAFRDFLAHAASLSARPYTPIRGATSWM